MSENNNTEQELRSKIKDLWTEEPLTDKEVSKIREIIRKQDRVDWFWGTMRVWALWIIAIGGAFTIGIDFIKKVAKWLVGM